MKFLNRLVGIFLGAVIGFASISPPSHSQSFSPPSSSGGNGPTLLTTLTASTSTSLTDTTHITSACKSFEFKVLNLTATTANSSGLGLYVSTNGGTTYDTSNANYNTAAIVNGASGAAPVTNNGTGALRTAIAMYTGPGVSGSIRMYPPPQGASNTMFTYEFYATGGATGSPTQNMIQGVSEYIGSTSAINAIQFMDGTGAVTLKDGQIEIWCWP